MGSSRRSCGRTCAPLLFGVFMAAGFASSALCQAQTPQYVKLSDLPGSGRSYPGDYFTLGLTESPLRPGTFFGQQALNENDSVVFWVNSKGVFGVGPAVDGNCPQGALIGAGDGTFWGTSGGMAGSGAIWYGVPYLPLYRVDARGAYATVHSFTFDEGESFNAMLPARGSLYGTSVLGGVSNSANGGGDGTLFKFNPDLTVTVIRQFDRTARKGDPVLPVGPLLLALDGNIYGTTLQGGAKGGGAVFKVDKKDQVTTVHSFGSADGYASHGGLVQSRAGLIYGTANAGGKSGKGTVFTLTPAGKLTVLHSFGDPSVSHDGQNPTAGLVIGHDGNLYGTTQDGGAAGFGTVFRMTPEGKVTILHSFGVTSDDGASPCGPLTLGMDGNLYGSTSWGGVDNAGTVFRVVIETPPHLSLSLEASAPATAAGNSIVYTIDCTNHGTVTAYDVRLTGNLPAHTKLASQGVGGNAWTQEGTQLTCDVGSIAPGKSVTASLVVNVDASAGAGTRIVNLIDGVFSAGTIPHSPTSTVTVLGHEARGLAYSVRNSDPSIFAGAGSGAAPKSPVSGKLQLASKLGTLWMNFDVSSGNSGASWKPSSDSTQGLAALQVIPPNSNRVDLLGTFTGPNDSLTVTASPTSGGFGYAGILNELQIIGILPKTNVAAALPNIAQVVPQFLEVKDFMNASDAFNQALTDYTNSNWSGVNADLQRMSDSLVALKNDPGQFIKFEVYATNLNPAINPDGIKRQLQLAARLNSMAYLFTDGSGILSDILVFDLSAAQHSGGVTSTFFGF